MPKRKIYDRVQVKTKYFHPQDGDVGVIVEIQDYDFEIIVKLDRDFKEYVFGRRELVKEKP